jgi:hypothetical protein
MLPGIGSAAGAAASSAATPHLTDHAVTNSGGRTATYEINSDGTVRNQDNDLLETWLPVGDSSANYEVKARQVSGDALLGSSDSLNIWLNTSSVRSWSERAGSGATVSAVLEVSIRDVAQRIVRTKATITVTSNA